MSFRRISCSLVCVALAGGLAGACRKDDAPSGPSDRPDVLLVTFDTTRADYISSYGGPAGLTPTVDRLAREGLRFEQCYTTAPVTLPSHASIFTGLYPFQHQLRDNGAGKLDEKAVTLAELFRAAGYRTGGFVGAFVLHSRYGLNQGFEFYSDDFKSGLRARMHDGTEFAERTAEAVTDAALSWLRQDDPRPLFLWIHYFDPHAPYEAPGYSGDKPREAYAAEIAFADSHLARLIEWLEQRARQRNDQPWVIFTADHGEGLGDHQEDTHGFFTYNTTLRVPLIIRGPGVPRGEVSTTHASLIDLYPTIAAKMGFALPHELPGKDLLQPQQDATSDRPLHFETVVPFNTYGWSPLQGIIVGASKLIIAPEPELYDLSADPAESRNVITSNKDQAAEFMELLAQTVKNAPGPRLASPDHEKDSESIRKLRSLGYVSAARQLPSDTTHLPDPKAMLTLRRILIDAEDLLNQGNAVGIPLLAEVLMLDPDNTKALTLLSESLSRPLIRKELIPVAQTRIATPVPHPFDVRVPASLGLALCREGRVSDGQTQVNNAGQLEAESFDVLLARSGCLEEQNNFDEAAAIWQSALQKSPTDSTLLEVMGDLYSRKPDFEKAAAYFDQAAARDPENPQVLLKLATMLVRLGRASDAVQTLRRVLEFAPHWTHARAELGNLLLQQGQPQEAVQEYRLIVAERPDDAGAHFGLGLALQAANQPQQAIASFQEAVRLNSQHGDALLNLGVALLRSGSRDMGREYLKQASTLPAFAGNAHLNLAIAAQRDSDFEQATRHLELAVSSTPPSLPAMQELASRRIKQGRYDEAAKLLEGGLVIAPDDLRFLNMLAQLRATCPDDSERNAARALELARRAAQMTDHAHPAILSTLASAQAESNDFEDALKTARRALELAPQEQAALRTMLARQIELFEARKPFRMTPEGG